jgi:hypothetical protein
MGVKGYHLWLHLQLSIQVHCAFNRSRGIHLDRPSSRLSQKDL